MSAAVRGGRPSLDDLGVADGERGRQQEGDDLDDRGHQGTDVAAHHTTLRQIMDSADWTEAGMLTANGRLALEFGLRFTAMREEWARWAAKQIGD
jgi:hypothetical protein